jgi:hypothetical protein
MKSFLSFSRTLSNELAVRAIALITTRKLTTAHLQQTLNLSAQATETLVQQLVVASLVKVSDGQIKLKGKTARLLPALFQHFGLSEKKHATLKADAKAAKALRQESAKKEAPKARKEAPKARKEAPKARKEAPKAKKEAPKAKKEAPQAKQEAPQTQQEAPPTPPQSQVEAPPPVASLPPKPNGGLATPSRVLCIGHP